MIMVSGEEDGVFGNLLIAGILMMPLMSEEKVVWRFLEDKRAQ